MFKKIKMNCHDYGIDEVFILLRIFLFIWYSFEEHIIIPISTFFERGFKGYSKNDVWWTEKRLVPLIRNWLNNLQKTHNEIYIQNEKINLRMNQIIKLLDLYYYEDDEILWKIFYPELIDYNLTFGFKYSHGNFDNDKKYFNAMDEIDKIRNNYLKTAFKLISEDLEYWIV